MPYNLPEARTPDVVGTFRRIGEFKREQAVRDREQKERERRQPIVEQLEQLGIQKQQQAIRGSEKTQTLQDLQISERERKRDSDDMVDLGNSMQWVMSQPDQNAAYDQVMEVFTLEGKPTENLVGRYDLIGPLSGLRNPDWKSQQKILKLVEQLPQEQRAAAAAISEVDPRIVTQQLAEQTFAPDTTGQLEALTAPLPEQQRATVIAQWQSGDEAGARKLAADYARAELKPLSREEEKVQIKAKASLEDLKLENVNFLEIINSDVFSESVGPLDQWTAKIGAAFGTDAGVMSKRIQRSVKGLVRGLVSSFPGALSEKELTALEDEMPKMSDSAAVWKDWYKNDFTPAYQLAQRRAGEAGVAPTTAKNQEALDWLEANPNDPRAAEVRKRLGVQ